MSDASERSAIGQGGKAGWSAYGDPTAVCLPELAKLREHVATLAIFCRHKQATLLHCANELTALAEVLEFSAATSPLSLEQVRALAREVSALGPDILKSDAERTRELRALFNLAQPE